MTDEEYYMKPVQDHRVSALNEELLTVNKLEKRLEHAALAAKTAPWKKELESRIPEKVYAGLESVFFKGFSMIFKQGIGIIEKTYNKEDMQANHSIRDYAVQLKGGRKELKKMHRSAIQSDFLNLAVTTVEGIGSGALGVGMPDIVLFLGTLLKGIYEAALNYGFEYESRQEQVFILKMMETALCCGDEWMQKNREVNEMLSLHTIDTTEEAFTQQMKNTASAFAVDMLLLKFIQGVPIVGVLGGAANPVYYRKVMKYVQLKYRKRYLLKQRNSVSTVSAV